MMGEKYTIGLDYGTLSGRGVLVRCSDGRIAASAVKEYSHGVMSRFLPEGKDPLPPAWCLEHPGDYLEVLRDVIPGILSLGGVCKDDVIGIGIDFTACTMLPIDEEAVPLCEKPKFKERRNAYVKLWKHHGAQKQADKINALLKKKNMEKDVRFGGKVSSELLVPKVMETLEEDPEVYHQACEFIEAGDWLTRVLTGSKKRSCSMAGYKAWWNQEEGYPSNDFYRELSPDLDGFAEKKTPGEICQIGEIQGVLSAQWAQALGLAEGTVVAPAIIDSHAGVPGSCVSNERQMMMVLGTSSVMAALSCKPFSKKGICGGVKGAIVPGYYGLESGLASVGDLFGWFVDNCVPESYMKEAREKKVNIHALLSEKAKDLVPGESGILALDWWNGNKTPYVDGNLSGVILGMTLNTRPEEIYRALIEATAFGTKQIVDLYESGGISVEEIIASGGISTKNPVLMQIYADVLNRRIKVADSDQAAALGSAIYAALSAGAERGGYDSYEEAVKKMSKVKEKNYRPNKINANRYKTLYSIYCKYGNILGEEYGELLHSIRDMK